ncbi:MAG: cysteine desulfurase [Treponema sp.]|nr:cysteine desulfurase [Candidatus Treponema equifaecale]
MNEQKNTLDAQLSTLNSPIPTYFDWAATSPEDGDILREALNVAIENFGNPSSVYETGKKARKALEEARESCAKTLGVKANQIFFTSGGTESDHIPLLSVLNNPSKSGRIILSGIEHPALREQCENLKKLGYDVVTVNPDKNGFVTADSIIEKLTSDTLFVTVMAVNNETGCIQPIYEIADRITEATAGKRRPHFHVDCVQAAGKIPLDISHKGIDSAAFSAHKICGPRGIGILYLAREIKPFLIGGGQENGVRSGTENLFGAVAFSKCLEKYYLRSVVSTGTTTATENCTTNASSNCTTNASSNCSTSVNTKLITTDSKFERLEQQKIWTKKLIESLKTLKGCVMVPELRGDLSDEAQEKFSPWVLQVAVPGIPGNVMVRALDAKGFSISTGSACSAKKQSRPILAAMGTPRNVQDSAVRLSFGPLTTEEGMKALFEAIKEVVADFN